MIKFEYNIGDVAVMKKPHPCGSDRWEITRVGADIKIKCCGCAHQIMLDRNKFDKSIKRIETKGEE